MSSLWNTRTDIPLVDRVRIQAEVLVPIMRELRAELGEQRANELLRRTLSPMFREIGRRYFENAGHRPIEAMQAQATDSAAGDAVAFDMRPNGEVMEADVTRCQYAERQQERRQIALHQSAIADLLATG